MSFEERLHPRSHGKFAKGSGDAIKVKSRRRGGPETTEHITAPAQNAKTGERYEAVKKYHDAGKTVDRTNGRRYDVVKRPLREAPGPAGPKDASHGDLMAAKAAGHPVQLHRYDPASKSWVAEGDPTSVDTAMAKAQAAVAGKHVVRLQVVTPGPAEPAGPLRRATGLRHKTEAIRSMRRQG